MAGLFITEARREGKPFLFAVGIIAALGGFLFGYDTGVISGALLSIAPDLHASSFDQEAIVGALLLGAVGGAVISGYLADGIGRKWTKVASGCVYTLAIMLLDRLGRRFFLITGTIGVAVALGILGAFFFSSTLQDNASYLALVALIVYIACFAIGLGPVLWLNPGGRDEPAEA